MAENLKKIAHCPKNEEIFKKNFFSSDCLSEHLESNFDKFARKKNCQNLDLFPVKVRINTRFIKIKKICSLKMLSQHVKNSFVNFWVIFFNESRKMFRSKSEKNEKKNFKKMFVIKVFVRTREKPFWHLTKMQKFFVKSQKTFSSTSES